MIKSELMHRQEQQWSRLGAEAPYWSVLSGCSKTADIALADKREFYRSGEDEILLLRDFFRYAGRVVPSGVCVDWGCGLGRVTIHLTSLFQQVIGVDISGPHLDLAREYISSLDSQVGQKILLYHVLENQNALAKLQGKVDFVHSILVLQHVPPPLMITTLTTFARLLKKGGYAFFQIPSYGENYNYPHYDLEHAGE
ncbi:MAG: class I SAM-dependent methyltransferase, partial [Pyrinomonadaceae bacterium]